MVATFEPITNTQRRPAFCTVCGSKLATLGNVSGYDAFTGEPVSEERLICNNPTISVENGLLTNKVNTVYHPSWSLDHANGQWVND